MVACIALVLGFRESSKLAAAYGIAVTGTMLVTTIAYNFIARHAWHWPLFWKCLAVTVALPLLRHPVLRGQPPQVPPGWVASDRRRRW